LRDYQPQVDDDGLLSRDSEVVETTFEQEQKEAQSKHVVVKTVQPVDKAQSLEKLQAGFDKLIEQLRGINEHLDGQVAQNEDLMGRIEQLPKLLERFPAVVENQRQLTEQLMEQLNAAATRQEQFMDTVEKIPTETAKQTDALTDIDHQLAASADTDVQMVENFNKFNETLDKLNQSSVSQRDSILQMSRTFAASDRYLKYILSRQRKSFMWVFTIAMGVCVLAILILAGVIIYLRQ
jgi:ABC-type transporter Mla subunit MlaD